MKFVQLDDNDNHIGEVKEAYLDGYHFGERELEGVYFGFMVIDGKLEAFIPPEFYSYMSKFKTEVYLARAVEYALQQDLFASAIDAEDDDVILVLE